MHEVALSKLRIIWVAVLRRDAMRSAVVLQVPAVVLIVDLQREHKLKGVCWHVVLVEHATLIDDERAFEARVGVSDLLWCTDKPKCSTCTKIIAMCKLQATKPIAVPCRQRILSRAV
jgi:hypothetical protein